MIWILLLMLPYIGAQKISADQAGRSARICIAPFQIHSERNLDFLSKGLQDIISSVIAGAEGFESACPDYNKNSNEKIELSNPDLLTEQALKYGADYILTGTLTAFGDRISTDAELMDLKTGEPVLNFHEIGEKNGDAIVHAELLADRIVDTLKDGKPPAVDSESDHAKAGEKIPGQTESAVSEKAGGSPDQTAPYFKSEPIQDALSGLTVGDLDGDGVKEIACASNNTLRIFRYKDDRLELLCESDTKTNNSIIGVDMADIDGDGKAELFITRHDNRGGLKSVVMVWNGTGLDTVSEDLNFYFRNVHFGKHDYVLLGQKRGMAGIDSEFTMDPADELFQGGIFEIVKTESGYGPGKQINTPQDHIIYGFAVGDPADSLKSAMVAFTNHERLRIVDNSGETVWNSDEYYGGGTLYMKTAGSGMGAGGRFYLPPRIHLYDGDGNGRKEIYVQTNKDLGRRILSRFRKYGEGRIECLEWEHGELTLKRLIGPFSGYIGDSMIGDMNSDGLTDLIFSTISSVGTLRKRKVSSIMAVTIDQDKLKGGDLEKN